MAELPKSGVHDPSCQYVCEVGHGCNREHSCSLCDGTRKLCDICATGIPHLCPEAGGQFIMVIGRG